MCELLGLSFSRPVRMTTSFRAFRQHGYRNPDGWGVAWYDRGGLFRILKEPIRIDKSRLASSLLENLRIEASLFISHIRWSAGPAIDYLNTHPFYRKLRTKTWVLAHHGVGPGFRDLSCDDLFVPIGETASERIFCHLLGWISSQPMMPPDEFFKRLGGKLREINRKGKMNLLFSDGKHLFAYYGKPQHKTLYYLKRKPPYRAVTLKDSDMTVDLGETNSPVDGGWIVASNPLTDELWLPMEPGELMVFELGDLVFQSTKETGEEESSEFV